MDEGYSIVFTIDDINYQGGAHVATLYQIEYLLGLPKVAVTVMSLVAPEQGLLARFPDVHWVVPPSRLAGQQRRVLWLLKQVDANAILCVPFENSVFRQPVAAVHCRRKIQWFHIDYATWRQESKARAKWCENDGALYGAYDQLVFVSRQARRGFLQYYPKMAHKCAVCQNLLGEGQVKTKSAERPVPGQVRFKSPAGTLRLITVARLDNNHKGIGRCLLAADQLRRQGYVFEWIFVGSGLPEEEGMLRQMARSLELGDSVRFAGHMKNPFPLVAAADVCCLFSYYEGIANTIFEAMMLGTPVMATAVSGADEQLAEGRGWLVDNSLDGVVAGLRSLLDEGGPAKVAAVKQALAGYRYPVWQVQERVREIILGEKTSDLPHEEKRPMVSAVVLVYNVARYLEQCFASLAAQTLDDVEILVVNDGSTDDSGEVIDAFVQRYPKRFTRLDKQNGGPGPARNHGLKHARGEYVVFIDGDDWVEPTMLEELVAAALNSGCDIVQADLYGENDQTGTRVEERAPFGEEAMLDPRTLMQYVTRPVVVSACTKLYRRSVFAGRVFPAGWYEDLAFLPVLFSYVERVYYLPRCLYHYRWKREGSIQNSRSDEKTKDIYKAMKHVLEDSNPEYAQEAAFSVYDHCCRFYDSQPDLGAATLGFIQEERAYFEVNGLVQAAIKQGGLPKLYEGAAVIPPLLFYCCPGLAPADMDARLAAWQERLPGFELREVTAADCTVLNEAESLYKNNPQKRAELAAYAGAQMLVETGGLYLDIYTELQSPVDALLGYELLAGFEIHARLHTHLLGAVAGSEVLGMALAKCKKSGFPAKGGWNFAQCLTDVLVAERGLQQTGEYQILPGRLAVFPASWLAVDVGDGHSVAAYQYEQADSFEGGARKKRVLQDSFQYPLLRGLALKRSLPGGNDDEPTGTPYSVIDGVIKRYGARVVLRQLVKALLRFVLPHRWYKKLEDSALQ